MPGISPDAGRGVRPAQRVAPPLLVELRERTPGYVLSPAETAARLRDLPAGHQGRAPHHGPGPSGPAGLEKAVHGWPALGGAERRPD
ncbi:hypothetical protein [Streptomyces sp. NBC_00344]|uniref:hypothetical protein n=1 Tax=Streptomyces sp. NBC_00344 TaxID=2975720 RepID=UPI002E201EFD